MAITENHESPNAPKYEITQSGLRSAKRLFEAYHDTLADLWDQIDAGALVEPGEHIFIQGKIRMRLPSEVDNEIELNEDLHKAQMPGLLTPPFDTYFLTHFNAHNWKEANFALSLEEFTRLKQYLAILRASDLRHSFTSPADLELKRELASIANRVSCETIDVREMLEEDERNARRAKLESREADAGASVPADEAPSTPEAGDDWASRYDAHIADLQAMRDDLVREHNLALQAKETAA